ncbi:MAG: ABC transporter ATP-binding protein [Bacteroidota bacterium]
MIAVDSVTRIFPIDGKEGKLYVLRGVTMSVARGQIVAIVGASGAGKSTLLHVMGTLDRPTSGTVHYDGADVFALKDEELARFRNKWIGFVFQFHHLLPEFSALENVAMPALIGGAKLPDVRDRAMMLLDQVGLRERAETRPSKLSGGELQRVAVARALMNSPKVILADEPSGNLDTANAQSLHELLRALSVEHGQTFVVVTHNEALAKQADKVIKIVDGVVKS